MIALETKRLAEQFALSLHSPLHSREDLIFWREFGELVALCCKSELYDREARCDFYDTGRITQ